MRFLARIVAGRITKWVVPVVWLVLLIPFGALGQKLADETRDETESFLPESAESTEVARLLNERFEGGQTSSALIVYRRTGGLNAADEARIAAHARRAAAELPLTGPPLAPFGEESPPQLVGPGGQVAYTVMALPDDFKTLGEHGKELREITGGGGGGLEVFVTGDAGLTADFEEVFGAIDRGLILATVALVLILLGAIYRSPAIAIIPLLVVFAAYTVAQGLIYLYATSGATVSSNSVGILVVLLFGVGTDYCLLLVSRYREELRRQADKHEAIARALRRTGPAIIASGLTVSLSMLVLLVADTGSIKSLGPSAAIGVACVLLAGLTLLPALLAIGGRTAFWPRRRQVALDPDPDAAPPSGVWHRLGTRVAARPAAALGLTVLLFGGGSLGLLAYKEDYSTDAFFKKPTESIDGLRVLEQAQPAGTGNPTTVLVERTGGRIQPQDLAAAQQRLARVEGIARVEPTPVASEDGRIGQLNVIFRDDPFTDAALARVPDLRASVQNLGPGLRAVIGGGSAIQYDFDKATGDDFRKIVPLGLLVIALILAGLLRALVAPLVLIGAAIASFFGTLGLAILFFRYVVGDAGVDSSLPVFAFIFLVALGVDYTIFLMSRVREEARRHGTREGTLRALVATGPVITSAGIILAGTFSVLMTLPVSFAFNIGFMVAVGILLDTFVVRSIMVPAAVELLGDRVWWPSTARGGGAEGALTEEPPVRERVPA